MFVERLKKQLLNIGFSNGGDTYEFHLSLDVFLRVCFQFESAKMYAISNGAPIHIGYVANKEVFSLINYLKKAEKIILTYYKNEGEVIQVINAINDWLKTYKTGYTYTNFIKGCGKNISVSFSYYLEDNDIVLYHNADNNFVYVNYDRKRIVRVNSQEMKKFQNTYDVLHMYGSDNPKIKTHIRKITIDNLLESL